MDKGLRIRTPENISEEISVLQDKYNIGYVEFQDELLMTSEDRVRELCEYFLSRQMKFKWLCQGRLNYAKPAILKLMKKAGCTFINYGIESLDDKVLKNMNKALNSAQLTEGIEATIREGISPGFNIIWGNIGDSLESLRKGVGFLLKYDDGAQLRTIRPVTPYPGSPLYYYAIEYNLLKGAEDFYENKHKNSELLSVNFTELEEDVFHEALMKANSTLISNYYGKKLESTLKQNRNIYMDKDVSFRGFRQT